MDFMVLWFVIVAVALLLVAVFFRYVPLGLWINARASGASVKIISLIGMRFRRISPQKIVNAYIKARKAGLQITTDMLETHFLAGGNIERVINALISAKQQEEWLAERAEEYGFKLNRDEFRVTYSHRYSFKKNGKNQVTLLCVSFEGILTVTDAARFKQTMTEGIGRAKAYGNGLLTVVSPQNVSHG